MQKSPWYWGLLPVNAVAGGLYTFIPLYIVNTGGSVIDVALAFSVYNFAVIPGYLLWGYVTDQFSRKTILVGTSVGMAICVMLMCFGSLPVSLPILYGVFGLLFVGITPASQLLVIETFPKHEWNDLVAKTNAISTVGFVIGILPGVVWTLFFSLRTYLLYLLALSILTAIFFHRYLTEPKMTYERTIVAHFPGTLIASVREMPMVFLHIPKLSEWVRLFRMLKSKFSSDIPVICLSMFLFFISTNLFFTPLTPYLIVNGLSDSAIFFFSFVTSCMNVVGWVYSSRFAVRHGEKRTAMISMIGRAVAMGGMGIVAMFVIGFNIMFGALILVSMVMMCYSLVNTPISTMLYQNLDAHKRGEYLGIYGAITSIGLLIGSVISGYLSFQYGFPATFLTAAVFLGMGIMFLHQYKNTEGKNLAVV